MEAVLKTSIEKLSEKQCLMQILSKEGKIKMEEAIEQIVEKTGTSKIIASGRINIEISKGNIEKDAIGFLSLKNDVKEKIEQEIKEKKEIAKKKEAKRIKTELDSDEFSALLNREFTKLEADMIQDTKKMTKGVTLSKEYKQLAEMLREGTYLTSLFFGEPGNGKTTIANAIGKELNIPVYSQNYSANAEEVKIIGGYMPSPEGQGFVWVDGQFTKAFREGGLYIAEEPNYAKPGVLGVMNNALDGVGKIVLDNGEVVERHPAFRFIACMNLGLAGTQTMNNSFVNRMNAIYKFDPMSKESQIKIIMKESGLRDQDIISKMVNAGSKIKDKIENEQVDRAVFSIRNLISWAKLYETTGNIIASAKPTVVWAVCPEDSEFHEEVLQDILEPKFGKQ